MIDTNKFRYKLTESELDRLTYRSVISPEQRDLLIRTSKLRKPCRPADTRFQVAMNRRGTIVLKSIKLYGGEDFGQPYHFLAEIVHDTTKSVFTRFVRENQIATHPHEK